MWSTYSNIINQIKNTQTLVNMQTLFKSISLNTI